MNRLFFYLLFLLSISLHSCITYIDKELDIKPKLVLHCYLVPQLDTTILHLTNSAPLFTNNPRKIEPVANATVEISDNNNQWVKLEYNSEHEIYFIPQAQFPINEGKTYYIRASAPGFETVSASCAVPYLREVNLDFVVEEHGSDAHEPYPHFHGYLRWIDYPGEENYYMFFDKSRMIYDYWTYTDTASWYSWWLLWDADGNPCIYSDKGQDGKKMSVLMMLGYPDIYEVTLFQTDRNCYLHEKSIIDYDSDLQSFMLEPIHLYSNIRNGYGVFGAFVMRDYVFEIDVE